MGSAIARVNPLTCLDYVAVGVAAYRAYSGSATVALGILGTSSLVATAWDMARVARRLIAQSDQAGQPDKADQPDQPLRHSCFTVIFNVGTAAVAAYGAYNESATAVLGVIGGLVVVMFATMLSAYVVLSNYVAISARPAQPARRPKITGGTAIDIAAAAVAVYAVCTGSALTVFGILGTVTITLLAMLVLAGLILERRARRSAGPSSSDEDDSADE